MRAEKVTPDPKIFKSVTASSLESDESYLSDLSLNLQQQFDAAAEEMSGGALDFADYYFIMVIYI